MRTKLRDVERYERFRVVIYRLAQSYGARALIRTDDVEILLGSREKLRVVLLEFPTLESARLFTSSQEYVQLRDDLIEAGVVDIWIAPGI